MVYVTGVVKMRTHTLLMENETVSEENSTKGLINWQMILTVLISSFPPDRPIMALHSSVSRTICSLKKNTRVVFSLFLLILPHFWINMLREMHALLGKNNTKLQFGNTCPYF